MTIVLLLAAGAAGAVSRYLLGLLFVSRLPASSIPLPMLAVNMLGSFGLGVFLSLYIGVIPMDAYDDIWFTTFGIGFFGAFTTFSTFAVEAVSLIHERKWMPFLWYVSLSIIGSLVAFIFGYLMFI